MAGFPDGGAFKAPTNSSTNESLIPEDDGFGGDYDKNKNITYEKNRQNQLETLAEIRKELKDGRLIIEAPMSEEEASSCMIYRPMERKNINVATANVFHQFAPKGGVIFPLPQGLTDSVKPTWEQGSAQWKGAAIGILGRRGGGNRLTGKPLSSTVPNQGGTPKQGGLSGFLRDVEGGIGSLVKFKGFGSEIMKHRGEIVNTHEEHYFKGVDFRSWTFTHKLVARSLEESNRITNIVDFMQFWASPRYNNGGTHIEYPAEFKIDFCHEGKPNQYLPVIHQCVCEGIDINYASDGNQFFDSGAATSVEIVINMKESIIRTRDHIENGEVDNTISNLALFEDRHNVQKRRAFYDSDLKDSRYNAPGYGGN